jgi:hypothetical protein
VIITDSIEEGAQQIIHEWVCAMIPHMDPQDNVRSIGYVDRVGNIFVGASYYNYQKRYASIEIAFAAETARWCTRQRIATFLHYPFITCECERATLIVPKRNRRARRFVLGLGFKLEGTCRRGFGNDDACIYGMLKDEAERWFTHTTVNIEEHRDAVNLVDA